MDFPPEASGAVFDASQLALTAFAVGYIAH
jgi:hypothetical protein